MIAPQSRRRRALPAAPRAALALAAAAAAAAPGEAFPATSGVCTFSIPGRGVVYDLEAFRGKVFPYDDPQTRTSYVVSLCSNANGYLCGGRPSAVVMLARGAGSACVSSFGRSENASVTLLAEDPAAGIRLSFSAGSACPSSPGGTQTATLNLACDASQPTAVITSVRRVPPCELELYAAAAEGCGRTVTQVVDQPSTGWFALLGVLGGVAVYLGGGVAYKRAVRGATGVEALPNIDTWRWLAAGVSRALGRAAAPAATDYGALPAAEDEDYYAGAGAPPAAGRNFSIS